MDLDSLNKVQKEVVCKTEGPLMVLAGAGSGKTKTLVSRISYLLGEKRVSPFRLLALTFSNKAAKEMRQRVALEVNEDLGSLQITTFHAFCSHVLRQESQYLGLSRNFTIYDTTESRAVVKAILSRYGISTKEISPYDILYFMDEIKNNGYYPGRENDYFLPDTDDIFFDYYKEYERELHRGNAVDFGGLITGVLQLFEKFPEVLRRYQERFRYILVDEYQDTNRAQFDLLTYLSEKTRNICVVGDEDQSIYSWRGADINNILDFEKVYPETEVLKLEQNYRSSRIIIEAASHVIARNTMRKGKKMWTENPDGDHINICECYNDKKEAEFIADKILEIYKEDCDFKDMAVFYRTNSQSRLIEDYLRRSNIPYRVVGGVKFYERKEVKDLLSYLRIIVNEKDSLAFSRIINVPTRGIGATSLKKIEAEAIKNSISLLAAVENIVENPLEYKYLRLSAKIKSALSGLVSLIEEARLLEKKAVSPSVIYEKILHESGYWNALKASKDYESQARMENLEELGNAIKQFEQSHPHPTLLGLLESMTLDQTNEEDRKKSQGEVSLMTVHGSKGLEFNFVFLAGAEENIFPSYRSLEMGLRSEEEERRLFYVAMTRAMEKLFITFAKGRMLFGQLKFNGPSRFIYEIPNKFYQWVQVGGHFEKEEFSFQGSWKEDELSEFNQENKYEEGEVIYQVKTSESVKKSEKREGRLAPKFPKGVRVMHSLYGEGLVLDSEGLGQDEKVIIKFRDGARKKFMVKFAPLSLSS